MGLGEERGFAVMHTVGIFIGHARTFTALFVLLEVFFLAHLFKHLESNSC